MLETYHGVFPIADVVAPSESKDLVATVEAVEEEPECVDDALAFIDGDEDGRSAAVASEADVAGLDGNVAFAGEPVRMVLHIIDACEVDVTSAFPGIEEREVGQVQRGVGELANCGVIELWGRMGEMILHIARPVVLLIIKVDVRRVVIDVFRNMRGRAAFSKSSH